MTTAFVEYQLNRRWQLKLNVNNVLDEVFVVGAQHTPPARQRLPVQLLRLAELALVGEEEGEVSGHGFC